MKNKKYYNQDYFNKRDYLDVHIAESLIIFIKDNHLKTVLDVGCGTGKLVNYLNKKGFKANGCDPYSRLPKSKVFTKARATKLPFKKNSFDLIISISVIEHLNKNEMKKFLNEAKRIINKQGFIFLITPNFDSPLRYLLGKKWFGYSDPTHLQFFTPKSLSLMLTNKGFDHIKFRFKSPKNLAFNWYLPNFTRDFPMPIKNFLSWLFISSPLSTFRDSFWIAARKK